MQGAVPDSLEPVERPEQEEKHSIFLGFRNNINRMIFEIFTGAEFIKCVVHYSLSTCLRVDAFKDNMK